jgi:acetone carboxylase gamma subunit
MKRERITEHLDINLDSERWVCRRCERELGDARQGVKRGLLVRERDPAEVHRPLIDPERYELTFAPDANWCRMLEYCCPGCAVLVEVEYLPPGHPVSHDIYDVDWLKRRTASTADVA